MIALRATRQAFKIACDVGFERIDATRIPCRQCGAELDWRNNTVGSVIMCVKCGETTELPLHLRAHVSPELPMETSADHLWGPARFLYERFQFLHEPEYGPVPMALAIFFILCVLSVLGMMAYTLIRLHTH